MALEDLAAQFIIKYEGYVPKAVWDVNAWRIGHGSGTITLDDGSYRLVKQGDVTTPANAAKDLARRVKDEFIPRVKKKIGDDAWNGLTDPAKIALIDLAYNYGTITKKTIVAAAQTGDMSKLAASIVSATKNDNKTLSDSMRKALLARRQAEADFITNDPNARISAKKGHSLGFFGIIIIIALLWGAWVIFF